MARLITLTAIVAVIALAAAPVQADARVRHAPKHKRAPKKKKKPANPDVVHAQRAYAALQRYLYDPATGLYQGSPYSHLWPYSQALAATLSMSLIPKAGAAYGADIQPRLVGLDRYWSPAATPPGYTGNPAPPLGNGGAIGYDDNEWVGIELMRLWRVNHDAGTLTRASQLFDLAVSGWDKDPTHPCPGGIFFTNRSDNTDRNTITNAPAAQLGVRLFQATGNPTYLDWAKRFYEWVRGCLISAEGLYQDHIDFQGNRDETVWTYNQGEMVGAGVMLYQATGDRGYLDHAINNAHGALAYFTLERLTGDPPYFVAIMLDNLALLNRVAPDRSYRATAKWYGDWAWKTVRTPANIFSFGTDNGQVIEQAAMVRVYATLAGATPP